jgi:hypothetical protein
MVVFTGFLWHIPYTCVVSFTVFQHASFNSLAVSAPIFTSARSEKTGPRRGRRPSFSFVEAFAMFITTTFALGKLKLPGVFNPVSLDGLQRLYTGLFPMAHEKKIKVASSPLPQIQQCPECQNELGAANVVYSRIAVCDHCGHHFVWSAPNRVEHLADPGTFRPIGHSIQPLDFLGFVDERPYATQIAEQLKLTAADCLQLGVVDAIIPEPPAGAHTDPPAVMQALQQHLRHAVYDLEQVPVKQLLARRYRKFRRQGRFQRRQYLLTCAAVTADGQEQSLLYQLKDWLPRTSLSRWKDSRKKSTLDDGLPLTGIS